MSTFIPEKVECPLFSPRRVSPPAAYNPDHADCYLVAGDALLALGKPYDALVIFDWMAGQAGGVPLVLAAEGCGRALLARKEFQKAVESFRFALGYARQDYYNQDALIRRLEGLLREAQRLAEMDLYGEDFVRYRDAERLRRQSPQMSPGFTGTNLRDTAVANNRLTKPETITCFRRHARRRRPKPGEAPKA